MANKTLRKRSAKLSLSDYEEPPKKRPKKQQCSPLALKTSRPKRKERNGKLPSPSSDTVKEGRPSALRNRKKQLLVSLNIQDNDLQVPGGKGTPEKDGEEGVTGGGVGRGVKGSRRQGKAGRPRLKLSNQQQQQQRDPSVVSDGGSSSNGSATTANGRNFSFKNPNFTVRSLSQYTFKGSKVYHAADFLDSLHLTCALIRGSSRAIFQPWLYICFCSSHLLAPTRRESGRT